FDYVRGTTANGGLLVVEDGRLVFERYFGKGSREATPNWASVGKSVTSVAAGILLDEFWRVLPEGLDMKVGTPMCLPSEAFPFDDQRKTEMRLGQVLSMTAGIRGNNPGVVRGVAVELDPPGPDGAAAMRDEAAFRGSLWCEPGGGFSYATASAHLASVVIRTVAEMELEEYVRMKLAEPLGWSRWGYGYGAHRLPHTPGGGGIVMRATDMARFGYLLLKEGEWAGRRVVSRDFVRACRRRTYNPHTAYGLQFELGEDGDAYWKSGSGGHSLCMAPSAGLVVVKVGGRDGQYAPSDTGLPEARPGHGVRALPAGERDAAKAVRETLRLTAAALRER
ncbi:MAG: serine hydrolase, partial [Gemmatimonadota bacterium]|nr:serine hydrolase [Gemmatimonadota bacterium]